MSKLLSISFVVAFSLIAGTGNADTVSFDTSVWDHGSGPQMGWIDGQTSGTTTVLGRTLTVSSTAFGTATPTADHFTRIDESFFSGFAIQAIPNTTDQNGATLTNFLRIDLSFSAPIRLDEFTLTDVDRTDGQWYDVIAAEAFTTTAVGAVGTGTSANYVGGSNIGFGTVAGLSAAGPLGATGNVLNTPENDIDISFDSELSSFSIYYWNLNTANNGAATQTIGIRGNAFEVSIVPEPGGVCLLMLGVWVGASRRKRPIA